MARKGKYCQELQRQLQPAENFAQLVHRCLKQSVQLVSPLRGCFGKAALYAGDTLNAC